MPPPEITRITPMAGWPAGTAADGTRVPGTLVIIEGRHYHSPAEMSRNRVTFAGISDSRVEADVEWASPNEIEYQPDGLLLGDASASLTGGMRPSGVAVDAEGRLYISDSANHRIIRFTPGGALSYWGSHGSEEGQFDYPTGIAVDADGFVYVVDTNNHRIQKLDRDGNPVAAWGSRGSDRHQFDGPTDVDVLMYGGRTYVFVADTGNCRVVKTDSTGDMASAFAMPRDTGPIIGVCCNGLAGGRGYGLIYALDQRNKSIHKFAWTAGYLRSYYDLDLEFPVGIEADFDSYLYVVESGNAIKKFDPFDPDCRQIARIGFPESTIPGEIPEEHARNPLRVAVDDSKVAYVIDQHLHRVVSYRPTDAQQIWVHVPEGAVTGPLRVETDEGSAEQRFNVYEIGPLTVRECFVTQGLAEYPLVASKQTGLVVRLSIPTEGSSTTPVSWWGDPVHDTTEITVRRDGISMGTITEFSDWESDGSGEVSDYHLNLKFDIPLHWIQEPGSYEFGVRLERPSTGFSFHETMTMDVRRRQRINIGAYVLTHLNPDGTPTSISGRDDPPFPVWLGDCGDMLSWLDLGNLIYGFATFNRLFPTAHSFGTVHYMGPILAGCVADGVSDDEVRDILTAMELRRLGLNEHSADPYDFIIAVVDRAFATSWGGICSPDSGNRSAIVSISGAFPDAGVSIAHEIAHLCNIVNPFMPGYISSGPETANSEIPFCESDYPGWNALIGTFVDPPYSPMCGNPYDDQTFFPAHYLNEEGHLIQGDYFHLFNHFSNPHPVKAEGLRELRCDSGPDSPQRPPGSDSNLTLMGKVDPDGNVSIDYLCVGKKKTPVTVLEDSDWQVVLIGRKGEPLLNWALPLGFKLSATVKKMTDPRNWGIFRVTLPFVEASQRVEIVHQGQAVHTIDVPSGRPEIEIITPEGGEVLGPDDEIGVSWRASHPQQAPLRYTVEYSPDDGKTFQFIEHGLVGNHLVLPHDQLPGSDQARIRVTASDGFHHAVAISNQFEVSKKGPWVKIVLPQDGQIVPEGKPVRLMAIGYDPEDGLLASDLFSWSLDDVYSVGIGAQRVFTRLEYATPRGTFECALPVGRHVLTVKAEDSDGNRVEDSVEILISADSDRDGYPDAEERRRGTDPGDAGDHPGLLRPQTFGQWQMTRDGTWTRFEVSNLTPHSSVLEFEVIREDGTSLNNHPVEIREGRSFRTAPTNHRGRFILRLEGRQSAMFALRPRDGMNEDVLFGYSTIRLIASDATTTTLMAHGWIWRTEGEHGGSPEIAAQGTVVIQGGRPFVLRAPDSPFRLQSSTAGHRTSAPFPHRSKT